MFVNRGQWAAFLFFVPVLDGEFFFHRGQSGVVVPAISKEVPVLLAPSTLETRTRS